MILALDAGPLSISQIGFVLRCKWSIVNKYAKSSSRFQSDFSRNHCTYKRIFNMNIRKLLQ